jgi:hypothetical protein
MTVENQATRNGAYKASPIDNTPFGDAQELPINFRMNMASMAGGLSLMLSHTRAHDWPPLHGRCTHAR